MTPAELRRAVARSLTAAGLEESPLPHDLFGVEPRHIAHRAFSVWVRATLMDASAIQAPSRVVPANSTVVVRYLYRIPQDERLVGLDEAMELEVKVVRAVMQADVDDVRLEAVSSRAVTEGAEWYLGELRFSVLHPYHL